MFIPRSPWGIPFIPVIFIMCVIATVVATPVWFFEWLVWQFSGEHGVFNCYLIYIWWRPE